MIFVSLCSNFLCGSQDIKKDQHFWIDLPWIAQESIKNGRLVEDFHYPGSLQDFVETLRCLSCQVYILQKREDCLVVSVAKQRDAWGNLEDDQYMILDVSNLRQNDLSEEAFDERVRRLVCRNLPIPDTGWHQDFDEVRTVLDAQNTAQTLHRSMREA